VFVEREISDEPLQGRILILELTNPPYLVQPQVPVALLPNVERRFAQNEDFDNRWRRGAGACKDATGSLADRLWLGNGLPENDSFQRELKSPVQYERREEWKDQKFE
jgi:hypothetical protein